MLATLQSALAQDRWLAASSTRALSSSMDVTLVLLWAMAWQLAHSGTRLVTGSTDPSETGVRLRGARLLFRGGFPDLALDVGDAGVGADVDLVVGPLEPLLALALGPSAAEERSQEAAQET
jgi:hypothetical protein